MKNQQWNPSISSRSVGEEQSLLMLQESEQRDHQRSPDDGTGDRHGEGRSGGNRRRRRSQVLSWDHRCRGSEEDQQGGEEEGGGKLGRHWRADEEEEEEVKKMFRNGERNGIRKKIWLLREKVRERKRERGWRMKREEEERGIYGLWARIEGACGSHWREATTVRKWEGRGVGQQRLHFTACTAAFNNFVQHKIKVKNSNIF